MFLDELESSRTLKETHPQKLSARLTFHLKEKVDDDVTIYMLKEPSAVVPLSFGKAPRDFVVLLETVVAFLLGAGGHVAEVPVKQFQLYSKHKGSY